MATELAPQGTVVPIFSPNGDRTGTTRPYIQNLLLSTHSINLFHNSLSRLPDELAERVFPGVHLDDLDAVDDLVHDADPTVGVGGRLHPEAGEHAAEPAWKCVIISGR